jgi:hypothetical protein
LGLSSDCQGRNLPYYLGTYSVFGLTCTNVLYTAIVALETTGTIESCETGQNFYCLDYSNPKCCWLNRILGDNKAKWPTNGMTYFKGMSRAIAMTCSGEVFVMLDNKKLLRRQYSCD